MAKSKALAAALKLGATQARQLVQQRDQALRARQATLRKQARSRPGAAAPAAAGAPAPLPVGALPVGALPPRALAFVQAYGELPGAGILVAEGDSWFDYPGTDILQQLEARHGYTIASVAHWGDRLEDLAYRGNQLAAFGRTLDNVLLGHRQVPRAILLSGGGNDVAGPDFRVLLNYASSGQPGLSATLVRGLVQERLQLAYVTILSTVTAICVARTGAAVPIIVHGYDYPVPDGRGFWGGWGPLPGPWLAPGFAQKGYPDLTTRKELARQLIDALNALLAEVAALPEFAHVRYLDLRGTLPTDSHYQDWWANELHPTEKGFIRVADRFAALLAPVSAPGS